MSMPANLFAGLPPRLPEEVIETLLQADGLRIERIVSQGQASPPGFWYDQDQHEWVLVLRGAARLQIENGAAVELRPGDYLHLPAHMRHRVEWTSPDEPTIWLAVHFGAKT